MFKQVLVYLKQGRVKGAGRRRLRSVLIRRGQGLALVSGVNFGQCLSGAAQVVVLDFTGRTAQTQDVGLAGRWYGYRFTLTRRQSGRGAGWMVSVSSQ